MSAVQPIGASAESDPPPAAPSGDAWAAGKPPTVPPTSQMTVGTSGNVIKAANRFKATNRKPIQTTNAVDKVKAKEAAATGHAPEEAVDPLVEIFVKSKLQAWDRDNNGIFTMDEMQEAMAELRETMDGMADLKRNIVLLCLAVLFGTLVVMGMGAAAYQLAKTTSVGESGKMEQAGTGNSIVTAEDRGNTGLESLLRFDDLTDEWAITDNELRELDTVSFTHKASPTAPGIYYFLDVAELTRVDSSVSGQADKLDILTLHGHKLRFWESVGALEVQWAGTSMWVMVDNSAPTAAPTAAPAARLLGETEQSRPFDYPIYGVDEEVEVHVGGLSPPGRLLSKGKTVFVSSPGVAGGGHHYKRWNDGRQCRICKTANDKAKSKKYGDCCFAFGSCRPSVLVVALSLLYVLFGTV